MTRAAVLEVKDIWPGLLNLAHGEGFNDERLIIRGSGWTSNTEITLEARDLLDLFLPLLPPQSPNGVIVGQLGQSLDGRIATESGHSHYVTGEANRRHLHRLRAICDAVIVGGGTALADDPQLTVRLCHGPNPKRVILDSRGNLPTTLRCFRDGAAPTQVIRQRHVDPETVVASLRAQGCRRILVEGGGVTVSRFLEAGCLDRLHIGIAPLLIGSGRSSLSMTPIATLHGALRPETRMFQTPPDTLFDCNLRSLS